MLFKTKQEKNNRNYSKSQNKIAEGTVFNGDIKSDGSFRIDGILNGDLETTEKIVVGENAKIEGNVKCGKADIQGELKGALAVKNNLIIRAAAYINADIVTGEITVEPGANLNGSCKIKEPPKPPQDDNATPDESEKTEEKKSTQ